MDQGRGVARQTCKPQRWGGGEAQTEAAEERFGASSEGVAPHGVGSRGPCPGPLTSGCRLHFWTRGRRRRFWRLSLVELMPRPMASHSSCDPDYTGPSLPAPPRQLSLINPGSPTPAQCLCCPPQNLSDQRKRRAWHTQMPSLGRLRLGLGGTGMSSGSTLQALKARRAWVQAGVTSAVPVTSRHACESVSSAHSQPAGGEATDGLRGLLTATQPRTLGTQGRACNLNYTTPQGPHHSARA